MAFFGTQVQVTPLSSRQHFLHYMFMGKFSSLKGVSFRVNSLIWPEIKLVQDFMTVFFICKFDEDPIKNEVAILRTTITETSPYSFGNFRKLSLYDCFMPI